MRELIRYGTVSVLFLSRAQIMKKTLRLGFGRTTTAFRTWKSAGALELPARRKFELIDLYGEEGRMQIDSIPAT